MPIIPDYLQSIGAWAAAAKNISKATGTNDKSAQAKAADDDNAEDVAVGTLFGSKAIIQLLVNPFSGALIDRIGYDIPMCIGLSVIFISTTTFAFGRSYSVLFLARSLQGVGSAFADTSGLGEQQSRAEQREKATHSFVRYSSNDCRSVPRREQPQPTVGHRSRLYLLRLTGRSTLRRFVSSTFSPSTHRSMLRLGILYEFFGKRVPFITLAMIALLDGILLFVVMRPSRLRQAFDFSNNTMANKPKGTPIWRLLMDPYIAVCAGALAMVRPARLIVERIARMLRPMWAWLFSSRRSPSGCASK